MGRGRQKAKHTKVARELKYFSPNTNLSDLERELATRQAGEDPWAEYADKYNDDDEEDADDEE